MASSSEQSRLLELMELHIGQGPCLDCHRTGAPVFVPDLAAQHTRWPGFAEQTLQVGFGAVYALPMRLRQDTIGSLNLFHRDPGTISPATLGLAQALADVATIAILQHRALVASAELSEQLQRALQGRIVIEQAKGVLAGREQIEIPAAFALMRAYSRHTNRAVRQVAHDVVAGELDAAQLRSGAGPTPPAPRPTSAPRRAGIPPRQERDG